MLSLSLDFGGAFTMDFHFEIVFWAAIILFIRLVATFFVSIPLQLRIVISFLDRMVFGWIGPSRRLL